MPINHAVVIGINGFVVFKDNEPRNILTYDIFNGCLVGGKNLDSKMVGI